MLLHSFLELTRLLRFYTIDWLPIIRNIRNCQDVIEDIKCWKGWTKNFTIQYVATAMQCFVPIFKRKILIHFKISCFILNLKQSMIVFILKAACLQYILFAWVTKYIIWYVGIIELLFQLIPRCLNALKSMYNTLSKKGKCTKTIFDLVKKRHD